MFGGEQIIIPNLHFRGNGGVDNVAPNYTMFFPINLPRGTRIIIRTQCDIIDATNRTCDSIIYGIR